MDFIQWVISVTPPAFYPEKGEQLGAKAPLHPDIVIPTKRVWTGTLYPQSPTVGTPNSTPNGKPGFC